MKRSNVSAMAWAENNAESYERCYKQAEAEERLGIMQGAFADRIEQLMIKEKVRPITPPDRIA